MGNNSLFIVDDEDVVNVRKVAMYHHNLVPHERLGKAKLLLENAVKMNALIAMNILQYSNRNEELFNHITSCYYQEELLKNSCKEYVELVGYDKIEMGIMDSYIHFNIGRMDDKMLKQTIQNIADCIASGIAL